MYKVQNVAFAVLTLTAITIALYGTKPVFGRAPWGMPSTGYTGYQSGPSTSYKPPTSGLNPDPMDVLTHTGGYRGGD